MSALVSTVGRHVDVAWLICVRTWLKTLRRPVVLTFSLVQPLWWMGLFGFLFHRFEPSAPGVAYLDFLTPGICAMTVLFGASQSGIGWIRDLQTGFLPRLLTTPASPHAILAGKIGADVLRLLTQAGVVLLLALAVGADLAPDWPRLPSAVAGLALFAAAFSALSSAIALKTRVPEAMATFVHVVNMPILFTSTALVPDKQMPDWLAALARVNPLTLTVNPLRQSLLGGQEVLPAWQPLLLLILLAALLYTLAARSLKKARGAA